MIIYQVIMIFVPYATELTLELVSLLDIGIGLIFKHLVVLFLDCNDSRFSLLGVPHKKTPKCEDNDDCSNKATDGTCDCAFNRLMTASFLVPIVFELAPGCVA